MKTFKVNGKKVRANNMLDAISKCKDAYIYTDLGQDYQNNANEIRRKGLKVSFVGKSNGFGMYGKIEGTRQQLEKLQELGYFENETIHDSIKDEYIKTPRGQFKLSEKNRKQLESEGYGYHHQINKDGKIYYIMTKNNEAVACSDSIKDATPIKVESIPYKNNKYVVLQHSYNNHDAFLVVAKENYHNESTYTGGGIVEYSLASARKTAGDFAKMDDLETKYGVAQGYKKWMANKDSIKDDDIDYLSKEEEQAIEDYKKAIANTRDPQLLRLFAHILKEEIEHLEELQNEEIEDSVNDRVNLLPTAGTKNEIFMSSTKNVYAKEIDKLMHNNHYTKNQAINYLVNKGANKSTVLEAAKLVVEDSIKDSIQIKVVLNGKSYVGYYMGMSSKGTYADVYIPALVDYNGVASTPEDDRGYKPKDGKYYIDLDHIFIDNPHLKELK